MIPGFSKLDIDAEGLKKKFGVLGEPLVLGVIVGALIGWAAQLDIKKILFLGVTMGAVMELIPRITASVYRRFEAYLREDTGVGEDQV